MRYTSGPVFDSWWRPNIFNSVLFKKACERERIHPICILTYLFVILKLRMKLISPLVLGALAYGEVISRLHTCI